MIAKGFKLVTRGLLPMKDNLVANSYPMFNVTYTINGEQFEKNIVGKGVDSVKQSVYISCKEDNPDAEVVIVRVRLL